MRTTRHLAAVALAGVLSFVCGVGARSGDHPTVAPTGTEATDVAMAGVGETGGGPVDIAVQDDDSEIERLHPEMVRRARALGARVGTAAEAAAEAGAGQFQYPLRQSKRASGFAEEFVSNLVDHDPTGGLQDFACGTRTYDGHGGTDIVLYPYRWSLMDEKAMEVVAALGGTIVKTHDGEYDRNCSTADATANAVVVSHDNGLIGYYWHLKKGSVIKAKAGDRVEAGDVLGTVGSSGRSTAPHLHFQVRDSDYETVDPWQGACNARSSDWAHQSPTIDTRVIRVATHDIQPPAPSNGCEDPDPGYRNRFRPGDRLWAAVYMRDQTSDARVVLEVLRPDRSVAASWTTGAPSSGFYAASYYWGSYTLPSDAARGEWTVRARLGRQSWEHTFVVGGRLRNSRIAARIVSRKALRVKPGRRAKVYVRIKNQGKRPAIGCRLSPGRPVDATFDFQQVRRVSKKPVGDRDINLTIPAKKARFVRARFKVGTDFEARNAEIPLQVDCTNTRPARYNATRTVVRLTSK